MRVLSLFTGIGGLDLGLEGGFSYLGKNYYKTGLETIFACDIKPSAKKVFDAYHAKRSGLKLSIASIVDLVKAHEQTMDIFPAADVVTGGFPCQDFSHCGLRRGFGSYKNHLNQAVDVPSEETRGMLYYWMLKVIMCVRPKVFVAENVRGILTQRNGSLTAIERIKADFSSKDNPTTYEVAHKLVNACEFGVPQNRERTIIIGVRSDLNVRPSDLYPDPVFDTVTCAAAFAGLAEPSESSDPSQKAYSRAAYMRNGQGQVEVDLDKAAPTIRSEHHGNIEYRRLSGRHGGIHFNELEAGMKERRLTIRECARLQSFPDDMEFLPLVSASEAYKLIGNAVPPLLGYAIAEAIVLQKNRLTKPAP